MQHGDPIPSAYVLRRLVPDDRKQDEILPRAFSLKKNETSLSVYSPGLITPRGLLQNRLNASLLNSQSSDETVRLTAEKWLLKNGKTEEEMYAAGWRIARVPVAAFEQAGLVVEPPDALATGDQIGHCDVCGSTDDFFNARAILLQAAVLLTETETFA